MNAIRNDKYGFVAVIVLALAMSTVPLAAQDQQPGKKQTGDKSFEGKIVKLYDYLAGEERGAQDRSPLRERQPRVEQQRSDQEQQPNQQQQDQGKRDLSEQERIAQSSYQTGTPEQPLAFVSKESSGVLGLGSKDVYVLVFDPNDPTSQAAYKQACGMLKHHGLSQAASQIGQTATQRAQEDKERLEVREKKGAEEKAGQPGGMGSDVKITGKVLEKGDIKALVVRTISSAAGGATQGQGKQGRANDQKQK